ncbi:MAG: MoxR-like ATPase [Thermodesulfobacteria bacterium]|nr:MoxR family ATPase [Thermodesulfobacteriota bacterium]MCU4138941.1 MoxR-like ATPase [Thermodesulfobacteriota bacterium]
MDFKLDIDKIINTLSYYLHGKGKALKLSIIALLADGHLLIEDLPGIGKTTLAIALAKCFGLDFARIQATSDLLPSDITGISIYNKKTGEFEFRPGPIFNNIVLVDEINRTTPKTQSALLEAMGEKQVTIEGKTYKLPQPFFVIATQNPIELYGTFPLPEAQLDRFIMKISIGYPPRFAEKEILKGGSKREELHNIKPLFSKDEIISIQKQIREIYLSDKIADYILDIIEATRKSKYLYAGLSTRGALAIVATAKANAYLNKRDYVIPEDIKTLAEFVITHRVIFKEEYEGSKREIVKSLVESVKTPA